MSERKLPNLDHMRRVLRIGMTRNEFFRACDDLMDDFALRIGPRGRDLVAIHVAEGDVLLCFLDEGRLSYVEYQSDAFLGEDAGPPTPPATE